jgi:cephalosporin hydroxylase
VINHFHRLYYYCPNAWQGNRFLGQKVQQLPFDLWSYIDLLYRTRPSFVVQTGVFQGGSVLFLAKMLDVMGADTSVPVVGVDILLTPEARRIEHPRISLVEGSSTAPEVMEQVTRLVSGKGMVILDSDHSASHVGRELDLYSHLVGEGMYLVVEDTNLNGHPVEPSFGSGPTEAVRDFLAKDDRFEQDDGVWSRQLFSFHAHGWLRRKA